MFNFEVKDFNDGIKTFLVKTKKYELELCNVGASVYDLKTYDSKNNLESIVVKIKSPNDAFENEAFFGSTIGRNAGRIKDAKFEIDGKEYILPDNSIGNNLHSSGQGISHRIMDANIEEDGISFATTLKDNEDGFPGDVNIIVKYILGEEDFTIEYIVTSTKDTIVNMTNHTYFNLSGDLKRPISTHTLDFDKFKSFWELDETNVPLNESAIRHKSITEFNKEYKDSPQRGMDHPFVTKENSVLLKDDISERVLNVTSSYDVAVLYTQNWELPVLNNKTNQGIAIEFQYLPNDININKENSNALLRKGEVYNEWVKYSFRKGNIC